MAAERLELVTPGSKVPMATKSAGRMICGWARFSVEQKIFPRRETRLVARGC